MILAASESTKVEAKSFSGEARIEIGHERHPAFHPSGSVSAVPICSRQIGYESEKLFNEGFRARSRRVLYTLPREVSWCVLTTGIKISKQTADNTAAEKNDIPGK